MTAKKILVIDDDPDILDAIQMLLEEEGYFVTTSAKGEEAERLAGNLPDLILLDVLLSGHDGREIARRLKTQILTAGIPIVMMSAHPTAHKTMKDYLVDDFIAKPFDIDYFMDKIKTNLQPKCESGIMNQELGRI